MALTTLTVNIEWFKEDGNCNHCDVCSDLMMLNSNCLYLFVDNSLLDDRPTIKLCDSCYSCLNDKNGS